MRHLAAGGLVVAAVLSLAACGGSGNSGSQPVLGLDDIRELTGLSEPVETAQAQQARQQEIYARADSLIISTMHAETVFPDETRAITLLTECSGAECELLNAVTGATDTSSIDTEEIVLGDAEAIGSAHGITLTSETAGCSWSRSSRAKARRWSLRPMSAPSASSAGSASGASTTT